MNRSLEKALHTIRHSAVLLALASGIPARAAVIELNQDTFNTIIAANNTFVDDFESYTTGLQTAPFVLSNGVEFSGDTPFIALGAIDGQFLSNNSVPLTAPRAFTGFAPNTHTVGMNTLLAQQDDYNVTVRTTGGQTLSIIERRGADFNGFFGVMITGDSLLSVTFETVGGPGGPGGGGGGIGNYGFDNVTTDAIATLPGDLNGDCIVDTADLGALIAQFGTAGAADLNNDDVVDTADLGLLISAFGQTCN